MSDERIYVQTNEAERNRVLAFSREVDGTLGAFESYDTGGAGDGEPHLTSQGSVVLSGGGSRLLVTNAGSGELSVFDVSHEVRLATTVPSGRSPKSVAEHQGPRLRTQHW